jgi:hypothetical protein
LQKNNALPLAVIRSWFSMGSANFSEYFPTDDVSDCRIGDRH